MTLPVNARVRAVPHFLVCLDLARASMVAHDPHTAAARFQSLQAELRKARALLHFAPTSGRPARLLDAQTDWGRFQAEQARQLAEALAMPELRELVLNRYLLRYAHGAKEVLLLALRHERQLGFMLPSAKG